MKLHYYPGFGIRLLGLVVMLGLFSACLAAENEDPIRPIPDGLANLISGLSPGQQKIIQEDPQAFVNLLAKVVTQDSDLIRLVDKLHTLPAEFEPADLMELDKVRPKLALNKGSLTLKLRAILIEDLSAMSFAAQKAGIRLDISSAYRSYAYQKNLFARYVKNDGLAEAERYSARPGASQHQLGLAIDFGSITLEFADTKASKWLVRHAGEFGFSLSYPSGQEKNTGYMFEPWHYRYVGRSAALLEHRVFAGSQQDMLVFLFEQRSAITEFLKNQG